MREEQLRSESSVRFSPPNLGWTTARITPFYAERTQNQHTKSFHVVRSDFPGRTALTVCGHISPHAGIAASIKLDCTAYVSASPHNPCISRFGNRRAVALGVLRITTVHDEKVLRVKVEGRLVGIWVDELRTALLRHKPYHQIEIDITDVTFVDDEGEQLLLWIHRIGCRFRRGGPFSDFLCKRLGIATEHLPGFRPTTKP